MNVLDEAVKIINIIKPDPWLYIFLIVCEKMRNTHKACLLQTRIRWLFWGKAIVMVARWTDSIVHGTLFLLGRMINKLWLLRAGYLADFWAWNFLTVKDFSNEIDNGINKCDFFDIV